MFFINIWLPYSSINIWLFGSLINIWLTYCFLYNNPMNITLRGRVRKRREDDDMMLYILPALSLLESNRGGEKKQRLALRNRASRRSVGCCKDTWRTVWYLLGWNLGSSVIWLITSVGTNLSLYKNQGRVETWILSLHAQPQLFLSRSSDQISPPHKPLNQEYSPWSCSPIPQTSQP